jgi:hypothetical protein
VIRDGGGGTDRRHSALRWFVITGSLPTLYRALMEVESGIEDDSFDSNVE